MFHWEYNITKRIIILKDTNFILLLLEQVVKNDINFHFIRINAHKFHTNHLDLVICHTYVTKL